MSIKLINNTSHAMSISAYKSEELSITTKMRLEALGIDPSSVTSEAQAQILIAQAEAAQEQNNSGKQQGGSSQQQLMHEAKSLAQKVGVRISQQDSLEDIIGKISETLKVMANDPTKAQTVEKFQDELSSIAQRANVTINIQENIFNKMNMISVSNRLILGI